MMKETVVILLLMSAILVGCGSRHSQDISEQSQQAKSLLQGIWVDDDSESIIFKIQGDSVYYPDSTSMPAYFWVREDTLYIGSKACYPIEKQTEHIFWFRGQDGELVKLSKFVEDDEEVNETFEQAKAQIQTLTEVVKSDTVVFHDGQRYHLYIAINPTRYKVVRHTLNDAGLDVENVYYDNIIHLSIFQGSTSIFSRDIRKQLYTQQLSEDFLSQAILTNMEFDSVDDQGFHLNTSICVPGDASCYVVKNVVSFDGQLSFFKH
ncbi:MAG: DUF4738 domain-containing protein [Prevotella sp.]|nr:DUF4738 domain-containing protein [Prevotella sp.]